MISALPPNATIESFPFYYSARPNLLPFISDRILSLAAPIVAYWAYSLFFHFLDSSSWHRLDQYRLHEPVEVTSRNKATVGQVLRAVVLQQTIQTALGLWWLDTSEGEADLNHNRAMSELYPILYKLLRISLGSKITERTIALRGPGLLYVVYWWLIPTAQFFTALFIMDTWQYFLHRYFHDNKYLYRRFHSVHHRLYVPYAFGALYNHWFEGLLLDTLGAVIAHSLSFMTVRQAIVLFTFSTLKTVDDHCGYALPFDPFQLLFPNNSTYHDIHHRTWGIKYNFSQPFYVHWDTILGTRYRGMAPNKSRKAA